MEGICEDVEVVLRIAVDGNLCLELAGATQHDLDGLGAALVLASLHDCQSWAFANYFDIGLVQLRLEGINVKTVLGTWARESLELALQILNFMYKFRILRLQCLDLAGVVLNDFELFLNIELLLLNFHLHDHLVVVHRQHLLLQHLYFVAEALQFQILLLLVIVLDQRFPGPDPLLKGQSLLFPGGES